MPAIFSRLDLYITPRAYWILAGLFFLFVTAYSFDFLYPVSYVFLIIYLFIVLLDFIILVSISKPVKAVRNTMVKWSLGDENEVQIRIRNDAFIVFRYKIIDELPVELQIRNFSISGTLPAGDTKLHQYTIRPVRRGELNFGNLNVFISSPMGILKRRIRDTPSCSVSVYPSILQMKKYSIYSLEKISVFYGIKKLRKLGHSYEFEQIKNYVTGDDMRHINWRATGRTAELKTNHFIEERSQPIYFIIDKSRNMNISYQGISNLDYSINTTLALANLCIQKGDRAGLITFSDKVGSALKADNVPGTLRYIMEQLYHQKYRNTEPDFEFLFHAMSRIAATRSLMMMFTNFETITSLERALPVLRKINQKHLLVVVLFENTELSEFAYGPSNTRKEKYNRIIARQFLEDKQHMIRELSRHGIQGVLTSSEDLTITAVNKYLEMKARGLV